MNEEQKAMFDVLGLQRYQKMMRKTYAHALNVSWTRKGIR